MENKAEGWELKKEGSQICLTKDFPLEAAAQVAEVKVEAPNGSTSTPLPSEEPTKTVHFTATVTMDDGTKNNDGVTWSISKTTGLSISENGVLTVTRDAEVGDTLNVKAGGSATLTSEVRDQYGDTMESQTPTDKASPTNNMFTFDGSVLKAGDQTGEAGTLQIPVQERVVTDIAITTRPTKTTYTYGDTLDLTGMQITVTYEDGGTEVLTDLSGVMNDAPNPLTVATDKVTFTYKGKTADLTITVKKSSLTPAESGWPAPALPMTARSTPWKWSASRQGLQRNRRK